MAGWAPTANGGKGSGCRSRARAEQASWQRAERWLAKRQQQRQEERRAAAQAVTARVARQRLEARS